MTWRSTLKAWCSAARSSSKEITIQGRLRAEFGGGIPRLVSLLHYLPLGGRSFYCSAWKWVRHAFRVYLSLISPYRRLIQLNRQNKVFRYLNTHLLLHMRDPKFKEQIIDVIFQCAAGLDPRDLSLCGNKAFSILSPSQNVLQNILHICQRMTKVLKIDLEPNKEKKRCNF